MHPARTRYIDREGAALAYQVVSEGPVDVVCFFEINQHLDLAWSDPDIHLIFERGATYSRTVYFQRRGFGLSEPVPHAPTIEQQADDLLAAMNAEGIPASHVDGRFQHLWSGRPRGCA